MKKTGTYLTLWAIGAAAVLTAATLTAATYAWFTANREVETAKVTARTGSVNLELLLSREDGQFSSEPMKDAEGNEYNGVALKELGDRVLMPVSTADLQTFVYSPSTAEGLATKDTLRLLPEEKAAEFIYHDTIYLMLSDPNHTMPEDTLASLYLDDFGTAQTPEEDSLLLNAARLGLMIGGEWVILRYSEDGQGALSNTLLDGTQLGPNQVLTYENGAAAARDIPQEHQGLLSDFQYSDQNLTPRPLLEGMKLGTSYQLDIYFYLEGCDPDCTDAVQLKTADLGLAFYAVLESGED